MKLVVCLDERGGMTFNQRRQSRDRILIENLLQTVGADRLWVAPYTVSLFEGAEKEISVSEDPLMQADFGEWCFVENQACVPYLEKIEEITVYWWNRQYPFDRKFDIDLSGKDFSLLECQEFEGSSHKKITKEIYLPCGIHKD